MILKKEGRMYFIFEGIDGSGKDLQLSLLNRWLTAQGYKTKYVVEPTTGPIGLVIREILASGEARSALPGLFLADRMQLQDQLKAELISNPDLIILSGRSFVSSLVYQQEDWPLDWLKSLHQQLPLKPDLIFMLQISPELALQRCSKRARKLEIFEQLEIQTRVAIRYNKISSELAPFLAPGGRVELIDGTGTSEEIHSNILDRLSFYLGSCYEKRIGEERNNSSD